MSLSIQQRLISSGEYVESSIVALYYSIHNEVATENVISHAFSSGKKVLLPVMSEDNLLFRELTETSTVHAGAYGIMEPCATNTVLAAAQADMIVIPGIAFDENGNRVGYGKGCYDKALHHLEGQGRLVAVCFDFQLIEKIIGEPHDVKVDMIITEKRIVHTRSHHSGDGSARIE